MPTFRNAHILGICLALAGAVTVAALEAGSPALADTDTGTTTANVEVTSSITLSDLTASFTLTGAPTDTPSTQISMKVTTNNFAGYNVTVAPATANLTGAIAGNSDVIPAGLLQVKGTGVGAAFTGLTFGTPLVVHTQDNASVAAGDTINNDYQITIPFVRPDTYTTTLNYVATTL
ncbi:hypothetical protein Aph01nite_37600 [Acrocarpospora phusangensis]|uniref:WxL domain-containing protein n=1 Tax=Acrocarpospora phusangensis TaxID=1070424 RepID=A0A919QFA7_9ACTN|nr:hypothetical protein [Acrocarpospora phusangensis]GIH25450.1 hypothetical protein Aph01nite_37600 [Acrocarpospora phusangensis]